MYQKMLKEVEGGARLVNFRFYATANFRLTEIEMDQPNSKQC